MPTSPPRRITNRLFKNINPAQINWSGDLRGQDQRYKIITNMYPFSKRCSIKTTLCENKLTSPPQRTLCRLYKNTNPAQIHWSGDLRGPGQRYKIITNMYPFSKIRCLKTTLCENKLTSPPRRTLCRLFKNTNPAQIHWSGDLRGPGQRYKIITNMYPFSKIRSIKTTLCENKLTSPPRRTLWRLFKNTNTAQIHWSGDLQSQGQR